MTDDELLINSYKEILSQTKENYAYLKKDNYEYTQELLEDCSDIITIMEDILPEISCVKSLDALDEEDYAFMFEMLSSYAEIFIIDGRDPKKLKEDEANFEQLMDLISRLEEHYVPQDYDFDEEDEDDA